MKKINLNLFKQSMSKFVTGVTVITINDNKFIGKTVNSFSSLSLTPPLILFSLDKKSSSINSFKKSTYMGVNILSKKQINISNYFSLKKSKWNHTEHFLTNKNIPMIKNCVANLNCKKIKTINQGDHIIFICKVTEIMIDNSKKPLIYFNSKYS